MELTQRLGLSLPVYVVITGLEDLPGFQELLAALPEEARERALGWSSPFAAEAAWQSRWCEQALEEITATLTESIVELGTLRGQVDNELYCLPPRLESLRGSLQALLEPVFQGNARGEAPRFRGLYLSGSEAAGAAADEVLPAADESWLEVDLPSGHRVAGLNLNETEYVYQEIFVDEVYSRDGIVLPPDAVVLDVGANIGLFSLYIASRAPRARVVAFEPLAPIRRRLEANLGRYAPQVEVFGIGLSDAEREETFTYYPGYSTFSGIAEYADASGERDVIRRYLSNQGEEGGANLLLDNIDEILDDRLRAEAHRCRLRRLDQVIDELVAAPSR